MKFIVYLIFTILLISCNKKKLDSNELLGLYGEIESYNELFLGKLKKNKNEFIYDTLQLNQYEYNDLNKVKKITKILKFIDEKYAKTTTINYNSDHLKEKEIILNTLDSSIYEIDYIYKDNQLSKMIGISEHENHISKEKHNCYYDHLNRLNRIESEFVGINTLVNDTVITKVIQHHKANGLVTETEQIFESDNGFETVKFIYEYNNQNLLSKAKEIDNTGELIHEIEYEYDFDKNGNWIERNGMNENELVEIVKRDIKYK